MSTTDKFKEFDVVYYMERRGEGIVAYQRDDRVHLYAFRGRPPVVIGEGWYHDAKGCPSVPANVVELHDDPDYILTSFAAWRLTHGQ
jgi:hypothetical protein